MERDNNKPGRYLIGVPPWVILGAAVVLVPIFVFLTLQNIKEKKENTVILLLEKGAALIRSFEAGTRTGMAWTQGGTFRLQKLLEETAQQPDIMHLIVTDMRGRILAHNDRSRIGDRYGLNLNIGQISRSGDIMWRQVQDKNGKEAFEVFRRFSPSRRTFPDKFIGRALLKRGHRPFVHSLKKTYEPGRVVFVGLDMGPVEKARKEEALNTVFTAVVLLLIGISGVFSLFLAQTYRITKTSLNRIKAFSDTMVENMPVGLLTLDRERRITSFNRTAEEVLQISSSEAMGKNAGDLLPVQMWSSMSETGMKKRIIEREVDCKSGDGSNLHLGISVSPLKIEGDEVQGWVILFRDLTSVKELEREIERNQRLASLGRLAAGVAHEIRNPLSSIKGFATYFKERYKDSPEERNTAEIMVQEVDRLNRVVGQLLEFSRPLNLNRKNISLRKLIIYTLKMVQEQAREKGIEIVTDLVSPVNIPVDQDRISQVLLNLFLNSLEAMEKGGRLSVGLYDDEESAGVKVVVSDEGTGISKDDLAHVFDPYFTTKQSGTGLGLAIVHRIVETHGGEIGIESEPGNGTRVTVTLYPLSDGNG